MKNCIKLSVYLIIASIGMIGCVDEGEEPSVPTGNWVLEKVYSTELKSNIPSELLGMCESENINQGVPFRIKGSVARYWDDLNPWKFRGFGVHSYRLGESFKNADSDGYYTNSHEHFLSCDQFPIELIANKVSYPWSLGGTNIGFREFKSGGQCNIGVNENRDSQQEHIHIRVENNHVSLWQGKEISSRNSEGDAFYEGTTDTYWSVPENRFTVGDLNCNKSKFTVYQYNERGGFSFNPGGRIAVESFDEIVSLSDEGSVEKVEYAVTAKHYRIVGNKFVLEATKTLTVLANAVAKVREVSMIEGRSVSSVTFEPRFVKFHPQIDSVISIHENGVELNINDNDGEIFRE